MHRLYVTDGIVLGKRARGESGLFVAILTRELGLVKARVQSARAEKSKLRYGLELLTTARFTFVKGRHEWHLTGTEKVSRSLFSSLAGERQRAGRITKLLLRLIHGEERSAGLYKTVEEGLSSLVQVKEKKTAENIETLLVLRILSHLGYLPDTPALRPFVEADFFSLKMAEEAEKSRALLVRAINDSLSATGL